MALDATLTFTDSKGKSQNSIKVLECDFGFTQGTDSTGKPTGRPLLKNINVVVETSADTQIADWAVSFGGTKKGKIEINLNNNVKKTIEFANAYCVQYHESFSSHGGDTPMFISFTISPEEITIDDNIYISNL